MEPTCVDVVASLLVFAQGAVELLGGIGIACGEGELEVDERFGEAEHALFEVRVVRAVLVGCEVLWGLGRVQEACDGARLHLNAHGDRLVLGLWLGQEAAHAPEILLQRFHALVQRAAWFFLLGALYGPFLGLLFLGRRGRRGQACGDGDASQEEGCEGDRKCGLGENLGHGAQG